ncbi:M16 family metallopeptidase [Dinghuibacter silviterrae]|uniref:Zinc protease n=1 Tax=Dinghuibacter silviterrae TaxID=1539049 RepID=A0A4R8DTG1_9BACT|nr:insulinase family protein [Dinghuibacter silviterrae]TDX00715.1 zinc protease [Dinghuibacter silviterrae]
MQKNLLQVLGSACLLLTLSTTHAQVNLDTVLPVDPQVRIGHLDNGLTYYIRRNGLPEKKVELRLVVNAGSILEDENQRGLAHFCEHMAFNGTKHFQKNDLVSFLQSIGVQFGADLNAFTSFDETEYILPIPTDKPGNLDTGFLILEDWAHNVSYTTQDINEERPVILEESRLGKGAGQRMRDKYFPVLFAGSKYAERLPIGLDSIIRNFSPDTLRKFYHDWYRPDLMAVVVVGDVDPDKAEALIKQHFAGLTNPSPELPRIYADVPARNQSEGLVVTDKEATNYNVELLYSFQKKQPVVTLSNYRNDMLKELFRIMIGQRLAELTQKENPPFLNASAGFTDIVRQYEAFYGSALVGKDGVDRSGNALIQEIDRVRQFGFTDAELTRGKKSLLNSMEQAYQERDKTESGDLVDEYIQNFLEQEPVPGIANEYRYYNELMPGITAAEVSALTGELKENPHYLVLLTGPDKGNFPLPSSDSLLAMADHASAMTVQPYEEKAVATDLITDKPKPGTVVKESKNAALGTTELTFASGVKVILKPTDFKNDEILLQGFRKGGQNVYGAADRYNAAYASEIVQAMGIGDFSPTDLKKINAGKTVTVTPQLGALSANLSGSSSVKDLETMLQMVYLYCTNPRKDTALFRAYVSRRVTALQFLMANPQAAFIDTMQQTLYQGNPLAPILVPHADYFKNLSADRILQLFKEQFGTGKGFTFTLVGSFEVEKVKPLLEQYLGSLPAEGKTFGFVDNGVRPLEKGTTLVAHKGKDKKCLILKFYNAQVPYSESSDLALDGLSEVLNIRIIDRLREKIGGIYSGGTFADMSRYPYGNASLVLQLPCNPDKKDTLLTAFREELDKIKKEGPTAEDLAKVKAQWQEKHVTDVKENTYWQEALHSIYLLDATPGATVDYLGRISALKASDIQAVAKLVTPESQSFTAIMLPAE